MPNVSREAAVRQSRVVFIVEINAATATALASTPTLCSTGQAPTGVLASGNATGCATVAGQGLAVDALGSVSGGLRRVARLGIDSGRLTQSDLAHTSPWRVQNPKE